MCKKRFSLTNILTVLSVVFLITTIVLFFVFLFNRAYFNFSGIIDVELAAQFGTFFQGLVGTMASLTSALFVIVIFLLQTKQSKITQIENIYFKMLDYHRENVNSLYITDYRLERKDKNTNEVFSYNGRRVFVIFKLQLFECIDFVKTVSVSEKITLNNEQIIDIAYMIFYYGFNKEYDDFTQKLFKNYPEKLVKKLYYNRNIYRENHKIGRTNQASLSAYFRNLYNMIIYIDQNEVLSDDQKISYIKILRAQLSNPEQCLIYFNVMSRFGKKWRINKLIEKYELIKNIPEDYCHGFAFKKDFPISYEDDELDTYDNIDDIRDESIYNFYGWQTADISPIDDKYKSIKNLRVLYDILLQIWNEETCAPRMRNNWKNSHPSYGQCSITAFLVQDIFGGEVYGILRDGGNYHCYNVIDNYIFDLTSEQFEDEQLNYENNSVQSRKVHFANEEKKLRYEYLKTKLDELLSSK